MSRRRWNSPRTTCKALEIVPLLGHQRGARRRACPTFAGKMGSRCSHRGWVAIRLFPKPQTRRVPACSRLLPRPALLLSTTSRPGPGGRTFQASVVPPQPRSASASGWKPLVSGQNWGWGCRQGHSGYREQRGRETKMMPQGPPMGRPDPPWTLAGCCGEIHAWIPGADRGRLPGGQPAQ